MVKLHLWARFMIWALSFLGVCLVKLDRELDRHSLFFIYYTAVFFVFGALIVHLSGISFWWVVVVSLPFAWYIDRDPNV